MADQMALAFVCFDGDLLLEWDEALAVAVGGTSSDLEVFGGRHYKTKAQRQKAVAGIEYALEALKNAWGLD